MSSTWWMRNREVHRVSLWSVCWAHKGEKKRDETTTTTWRMQLFCIRHSKVFEISLWGLMQQDQERERDRRTDGMLDDGGGDEGEEAERKQKHHVRMFEVLVDHFICFGALICPLNKNTRQRRRRRKKTKQIRRKDDKVRTPSKATDQAKRYNGILYEHIKAIGCHQSALLLPLWIKGRHIRTCVQILSSV